MKCQCGNENAYHLQLRYDVKEKRRYEVCDKCSRLVSYALPDVYFREPYFDEHLADSKNPHGHWISSKGEKKAVMQKLGLFEAGDRIRGSRNDKKTRIIYG
jgi:hypothetical protein